MWELDIKTLGKHKTLYYLIFMDYFITPSYNLVNKDMNGKTSPGQRCIFLYLCRSFLFRWSPGYWCRGTDRNCPCLAPSFVFVSWPVVSPVVHWFSSECPELRPWRPRTLSRRLSRDSPESCSYWVCTF